MYTLSIKSSHIAKTRKLWALLSNPSKSIRNKVKKACVFPTKIFGIPSLRNILFDSSINTNIIDFQHLFKLLLNKLDIQDILI